MKKWWILAPALLLVFAVPAMAQDDDPFRPGEERDDDDGLSPEEAMRLMKESMGLMMMAEELLHDSSRGKALATEKDIVKKLEELLGEKQDVKDLTKKILKKIDKIMGKARDKQKGAIDKLAEIIRKAKACSSSSCKSCQKKSQPKPGQKTGKAQKPGSPATSPYNPNRTSPPSKFRSRADRTGAWGHLPPRLRDAMLHGQRDIDDYPPEFREALKEYMKAVAGGSDR